MAASNEVLNDVQQPRFVQHPIEQHFGVHVARVAFVQALPFREVFPLTGDRAVAGAMTVADDEKSVEPVSLLGLWLFPGWLQRVEIREQKLFFPLHSARR